MSGIPNSVLLKVHRARVHADDLTTEIRSYFDQQPARLVEHSQSTYENPTLKLETAIPIPNKIALIAGDCVQNLRSALDYLVWELVLSEGSTPTKQAFPICTTPEGWKAVLKNGRLSGISPAALEEIHNLQPYRCADFRANTVYVLDELANMNKHRHLFVTMLASVTMSKFVPVTLPDGDFGYMGNAYADEDTPIPANVDVGSFIAFDEGIAKGLDIGAVVGKLLFWADLRIPLGFSSFFK